MQRFFTTLFGGFVAIIIGVGLAWSIRHAWSFVGPRLNLMSAALPSASAADGTTISGFTRVLRYSASEEEDLIDRAAHALTLGTVGGVGAKAYIVKDLTTDTVVIQASAERLLPIASLTKLVTAVVARRLIPADDRIALSASIISTYGNTAGLRIGETITSGDLLYPLLMVSSNDAAEAYASHYGRQAFIKAMNSFAQSVGAYRTSFADPSGLSPQNVSTANDLALILEWIRDNDPGILEITQLKSKTVRSHVWTNPTHFLSWSYYLGGKNGYTDEADRTAAGLFSLGPRKDVYAVVVLGTETRDSDIIALLKKVK